MPPDQTSFVHVLKKHQQKAYPYQQKSTHFPNEFVSTIIYDLGKHLKMRTAQFRFFTIADNSFFRACKRPNPKRYRAKIKIENIIFILTNIIETGHNKSVHCKKPNILYINISCRLYRPRATNSNCGSEIMNISSDVHLICIYLLLFFFYFQACAMHLKNTNE